MIWVKLWATCMLKPLGESTTFIHLPWVFFYDYNISNQGCGLRTITRSPEVANHEILGALHLPTLKYLQVFSSHPMTKVHCLQHPGASFKIISSPYCTISKLNVCESHSKKCKSIDSLWTAYLVLEASYILYQTLSLIF